MTNVNAPTACKKYVKNGSSFSTTDFDEQLDV